MKISRRDFLKWCIASAGALKLSTMDIDRLVYAAETSPAVIWLQGAACSGCSISLLNSVELTTIDDILLNKISMKYHHNLMTAAGDLAISHLDSSVAENLNNFILVVEGGVPTGLNGEYCILTERNGQPWTMQQAVLELGQKAKYVVSVGTCASFGGIAAANGNPTGIVPVSTVLSGKTTNPVINLPGCPTHPYTIAKTLVDLILYGMPTTDNSGRPTEYYPGKVHAACYRRGSGKAAVPGATTGCFLGLGCFGPDTTVNCPSRKWNNNVNWCHEAGHHCIGCAGESFGTQPFYKFK